ncbi:MAG: hypothetical protein ACOC37_02165 [Spirochaetota bacterium]
MVVMIAGGAVLVLVGAWLIVYAVTDDSYRASLLYEGTYLFCGAIA